MILLKSTDAYFEIEEIWIRCRENVAAKSLLIGVSFFMDVYEIIKLRFGIYIRNDWMK